MTKIKPLFSCSLLSVLAATVTLATLTASAHAGNMYIFKDKGGQVLLTNVNPSGNFDSFTKKVKVTYYKDASSYSNNNSASNYGSSAASNSGSRNAYDGYIIASAARHGVDPGLMKAMMHTESAFNPNARSPVGAQGLMQLMPATARRFKVINAWDPAENIEGSAKYIAWLMRRFNNNIEFAVAGYNAGEGNVDKYKGIPPFRETRNYVKRVMDRYNSLYKGDASLSANNSSFNSGSFNGSSFSDPTLNSPSSNPSLQNISYGTINNKASYANSAFNALN